MLLSFAMNDDTIKDIFKNLDAVYEKRSLARRLVLQKRLLSLKLQKEISLLQHCAKFDEMITEVLAAGASIDEIEKNSYLLLTLPSAYDSVATELDTFGENNLNLAFVKKTLLVVEEKLRSEERSTVLQNLNASTSTVVACGSKKVNKWKQQRQVVEVPSKISKCKPLHKLTCEHCGRHNHQRVDRYYYKRMMLRKSMPCNY